MKTVVDKYTILKWLLSEDDDAIWIKLQSIREEHETKTAAGSECPLTGGGRDNGLQDILTDEILPYTRVKNHVKRWSY